MAEQDWRIQEHIYELHEKGLEGYSDLIEEFEDYLYAEPEKYRAFEAQIIEKYGPDYTERN